MCIKHVTATTLKYATFQVGRHGHVDLLRLGQVQPTHNALELFFALSKAWVQRTLFSDSGVRPALVVMRRVNNAVSGQRGEQLVVHGVIQNVRRAALRSTVTRCIKSQTIDLETMSHHNRENAYIIRTCYEYSIIC